MLALPLLALSSVADDYTTQLKTNMTLIVPLGSASWKDGIARARKSLGNKVSAVAIFSSPDDVQAFGPIANTVGKQLGGERAVFIAPVLDATSSTIGDDTLSLPHVILELPSGTRKPWADWLPNMFTPQDRVKVAKSLAAWIGEQLDDCAEAGECDDMIDQSKAAVVRHRVQEDLRTQSGERPNRFVKKKTVAFDPMAGALKTDGEEKVLKASELDQKPKAKRRRKKGRKARAKEEL